MSENDNDSEKGLDKVLWSGETKVELFGIGCIRVGGREMLSTSFPSPLLPSATTPRMGCWWVFQHDNDSKGNTGVNGMEWANTSPL